MADPEDMEALAAQEHESWSKWAQWELDRIAKGIACGALGDEELDPERFDDLGCVKRWRRQIATPYADLSEKEKESDRKVVRKKLALYRP